MKNYTPTIGIEVHAELNTKTKMFCGCKNDPHNAEPNSLVCPVCLAHPGTLPTVNKKAVESVLKVGVAIGGSLADYSEFDRKNYFYPDIPKAYQLSQYAYPFVSGGELGGVAITRVHLEEDTARSQHEGTSGSAVDFNRAGVPLMELVTEPVIHSAGEAGAFARELQLLLRTISVSEANMEKGEMRVEANISISKDETLGTKVEVKNLNSFKSVEQAIEYEINRQTKLLEAGDTVQQETRGWDEQKGITFSQRSKESADDYRYFPDPDIPKYRLKKLEEMGVSRLSEKLPPLPNEIRAELKEAGLLPKIAEQLLSDQELLKVFIVVKNDATLPQTPVLAANYLTSDIPPLRAQKSDPVTEHGARMFTKLIEMVAGREINSRIAKDLLTEVLFDELDPQELASERGLTQKSDPAELESLVNQVITENQAVVAEYKAGKDTALKYLVGQGMKLSRGSADPATLNNLLAEKIHSS